MSEEINNFLLHMALNKVELDRREVKLPGVDVAALRSAVSAEGYADNHFAVPRSNNGLEKA